MICNECGFEAPQTFFPQRKGSLRCPKCHTDIGSDQLVGQDLAIDPGPQQLETLADAPPPAVIRNQKEDLAYVFAQTSDAIDSCPTVSPALRLGWSAFRSHYTDFYKQPTTSATMDDDIETMRSFRTQLLDWHAKLEEACPGIFPQQETPKESSLGKSMGDLGKSFRTALIIGGIGLGVYILWHFYSQKKAAEKLLPPPAPHPPMPPYHLAAPVSSVHTPMRWHSSPHPPSHHDEG